MANGAAPSGNDPISAIANAISNITGAILGYSNAKQEREFRQAYYNEESDVQAFIGKFERWFDAACRQNTTPEQIMLNEESIDGWQIQEAGSIEMWISQRRERDRAWAIYSQYHPKDTFYKNNCAPFWQGDNLIWVGAGVLLLIIIFLIYKAI